jgi:hypothetical protein
VAGVRDRLKVTVFPYLTSPVVHRYLTQSMRFADADAEQIVRTVGGHLGNVVECYVDAPRYGLQGTLSPHCWCIKVGP